MHNVSIRDTQAINTRVPKKVVWFVPRVKMIIPGDYERIDHDHDDAPCQNGWREYLQRASYRRKDASRVLCYLVFVGF
jgi:hypothetical protein